MFNGLEFYYGSHNFFSSGFQKTHENNASIRMMKHIFAAYNSISKNVQCNIATQTYKSLPS